MKRILITGGTGFVGANLARRLLREGHAVHLLVRPQYTAWRIAEIGGDVALHEVSLEDAEKLKGVIRSLRPEWIFHLAAHGAYSWEQDLQRMVQTNVLGTMNLVQACLKSGFEALVNTGSSSEYGWKPHAPAETEHLEPNSHYAVTKACATHYCRFTAREQGVPIPTLRLYTVYGAYEDPGRFMPTLVVRGLRGELPPLVNPDVARDYVAVEDVTDAYLRAATERTDDPGAVYNVGSGVQTSIREMVEIARRTLAIPVEPRWGSMPNRQWDTATWVADSRKIRRELGWAPRVSLEEGFTAFMDWFREHPALLEFYETRMRRME